MDFGTRFLILSLGGENYAIPIARLLEITMPRNIQKDPKQAENFEGKVEYRGTWIPVVNIKKILNVAGGPGENLLVVNSSKGVFGLLVDSVVEILDTEQKPAPMPNGVVNPGLPYYRGILRHKDGLVPLLDEDGLLT
jgi:purine-binding chemotaxis protein CheW